MTIDTGNPNTAQFTVWTPAGYRGYVTLELTNTADIDAHLQALGFLMSAPGTDFPPGTNIEEIGHVCRAEHINRDDRPPTPKVYLYHVNDALRFTIGAIYLNNAEDVAQFEAQSGLTLKSLPLYDGDLPLDRNSAKADKYIIPVKRVFEIAKVPDGTRKDGKPRYRYEYARPLTITPETPQTPPAPKSKTQRDATLSTPFKAGRTAQNGAEGEAWPTQEAVNDMLANVRKQHPSLTDADILRHADVLVSGDLGPDGWGKYTSRGEAGYAILDSLKREMAEERF